MKLLILKNPAAVDGHLHLVYCYFLPTLTGTQKRNQESDKRSKICATILSHHHRVHLSKVQFNFDFDCGQMRFK